MIIEFEKKHPIVTDIFSNGPLVVFMMVLLAIAIAWMLGKVYGNW